MVFASYPDSIIISASNLLNIELYAKIKIESTDGLFKISSHEQPMRMPSFADRDLDGW